MTEYSKCHKCNETCDNGIYLEIPKPEEVCEWTSSDISQWSIGSCGGETSGNINRWKVCPYCGKKIKVKE